MIAGIGHAKAILIGEHAVVAGHPALVAALETGLRARIVGPSPALSVRVEAWGLHARAGEAGAPGAALLALTEALGREGVPANLALELEARVPFGAGLGSSAALGVAVVRALAGAASRPEIGADAARLCAASEAVFHGSASGVDAAIAAQGGVGLYRRGQGLEPLRPGRAFVLVVAQSGPRPPTRALVEKVAQRAAEDPRDAAALARLGALATSAASALAEGDLPEVGDAMNEARRLLAQLGLSTPALDALCDAALDVGALGAKLTGAGGGGCMLALCEPQQARVVEEALAGRASWTRAFPLQAQS